MLISFSLSYRIVRFDDTKLSVNSCVFCIDSKLFWDKFWFSIKSADLGETCINRGPTFNKTLPHILCLLTCEESIEFWKFWAVWTKCKPGFLLRYIRSRENYLFNIISSGGIVVRKQNGGTEYVDQASHEAKSFFIIFLNFWIYLFGSWSFEWIVLPVRGAWKFCLFSLVPISWIYRITFEYGAVQMDVRVWIR